MNEKIIFDIVLILLLTFLIVSTFVDYYKLTHPCMTTINNAKVLCTKIDKHVVIECINDKNVIKKVSGTATFDYEEHIRTKNLLMIVYLEHIIKLTSTLQDTFTINHHILRL